MIDEKLATTSKQRPSEAEVNNFFFTLGEIYAVQHLGDAVWLFVPIAYIQRYR